jgi:Kef-type K+ transport system membrane component KefB
MILLIVIILVAAAITGSLGGVLEIAAGVAVGLLLFVIGVALLGYWFARYKWRQATREYRSRWERGDYPQRYRDV